MPVAVTQNQARRGVTSGGPPLLLASGPGLRGPGLALCHFKLAWLVRSARPGCSGRAGECPVGAPEPSASAAQASCQPARALAATSGSPRMRGFVVNYRRRSLRNVPARGGNGRARHFNSEVSAARRQSPFPHTHTHAHTPPRGPSQWQSQLKTRSSPGPRNGQLAGGCYTSM
jgi:hypothetical protein